MFLEEKSLLISQHEQNMNCVLNLQMITEKLLFSMNVPSEIAQKYNFLKQQTYESLGLLYSPAVVTYVPPLPSTNGYSETQSQPYSSSNYHSNGGSIGARRGSHNQGISSSYENPALFNQMEDLLRSLVEHLSSASKSLVLHDSEENSFVQESLSRKFLEPPLANQKEQSQRYPSPSSPQRDGLKSSGHQHHFAYSQFPRDFLQRIDQIKKEFDDSLWTMVAHFGERRQQIDSQWQRKVDLLQGENNKLRVQMENSKQQRERQDCQCQFFESELSQTRDEHQKYVARLKQKYENEIYEARKLAQSQGPTLDQFREQLFGDMKARVFQFVQQKSSNYIDGFCRENATSQSLIDPIELLIYIIQRIEGDNNWLVDKLAEVEEEKRRLLEKSHLDQIEEDILNGKIFNELIEQAKQSDQVLESFAFHRDEFLATLESTPQSQASIMPLKRSVPDIRSSADKENSLMTSNHTPSQSISNQNQNALNSQSSKRHNFPTAAGLRESLQSNRSSSQQRQQDSVVNKWIVNKDKKSEREESESRQSNFQAKNLNQKFQNLMRNSGQQIDKNSVESRMSAGALIQDDESAVLGGTLNAMMLKDQENSSNFNSLHQPSSQFMSYQHPPSTTHQHQPSGNFQFNHTATLTSPLSNLNSNHKPTQYNLPTGLQMYQSIDSGTFSTNKQQLNPDRDHGYRGLAESTDYYTDFANSQSNFNGQNY